MALSWSLSSVAIDMIFGQDCSWLEMSEAMLALILSALAGLVIVYLYKHFGGRLQKGWALSLISDTRVRRKSPWCLGLAQSCWPGWAISLWVSREGQQSNQATLRITFARHIKDSRCVSLSHDQDGSWVCRALSDSNMSALEVLTVGDCSW